MAIAPAHLNKSNHGHMLFVSINKTTLRSPSKYGNKLREVPDRILELYTIVIIFCRWVEFLMI